MGEWEGCRVGDFEEVERINDEINRKAVAELKVSNPDLDTFTIDLYLQAITGDSGDEPRRQLMERLGGTFVAYDGEIEESDQDKTVDEDDAGAAKIGDDSSEDRKTEGKDDEGDAASGTEDMDDEYDYYSLSGNEVRYGGSGSIMRNLQTVSLRAVYLTVTIEGAKAIVDWLCSLGAYDITYAFYTDE